MKLFRFACVSLTVFCVSLSAAQAPVTPAFEVASIKPAPPIQTLVAQIQSGKLRAGMTVDGARVDIAFISLTNLILAAYKVKPYQIASPDWLKSQMYEIHAKLPEGSNKDQIPEMLQALLAERFKLAFHREAKDLPVYALLVSKNGPKLKEAVDEAPASAPAQDPAKTPTAKEDAGKQLGSINTPEGEVKIKQEGSRGVVISSPKSGQMRMAVAEDGGMRMEMSKMKMEDFVGLLTPLMDRPVIDMTELKGFYQIALELPKEEIMNLARRMMPELAAAGGVSATASSSEPGGIAASDPSGGALFHAVQQLGLKLDPRKMPTEMLVIDHVEKEPTEN